METDEESRNCDSAGRSMLGGTIEPKLTLGADFFAGTGTVYRSECVLERHRIGQAELGIRIRGLNEWLSGRRFSEDKKKNEKWTMNFRRLKIHRWSRKKR